MFGVQKLIWGLHRRMAFLKEILKGSEAMKQHNHCSLKSDSGEDFAFFLQVFCMFESVSKQKHTFTVHLQTDRGADPLCWLPGISLDQSK